MKENRDLTSSKKQNEQLPFWVWVVAIFGVICFDQSTKWLAVVYLQGGDSFPIWENVLHFTFVKNEGAAFGMLSNARWVFMVVSTVAIIGLSVYLFGYRKESNWVKTSLAMIIGGGIGNMIDRVALGYVVDFIDFTLINFAVFNVADSFVTVGAGIMIVYLLHEQIKELKAAKAAKASEEDGTQSVQVQDAPKQEADAAAFDATASEAEADENGTNDVQ